MPYLVYIVMLLSLIGCQREAVEQCMKSESQPHTQVAAQVAIVPVVDHSNNKIYPWSFSEEFTSSIYSHFSQSPLSLESISKVRALEKKNRHSNPFGKDISWMKQAFENQQYVVFLELVEHDEVLKKKNIDPKMCSADLHMCMRIRVVDLRANSPKVILQELYDTTHFIPRQLTQFNFQPAAWGEENFAFSPLGLAHLEFVRKVCKRIEDYILYNS